MAFVNNDIVVFKNDAPIENGKHKGKTVKHLTVGKEYRVEAVRTNDMNEQLLSIRVDQPCTTKYNWFRASRFELLK